MLQYKLGLGTGTYILCLLGFSLLMFVLAAVLFVRLRRRNEAGIKRPPTRVLVLGVVLFGAVGLGIMSALGALHHCRAGCVTSICQTNLKGLSIVLVLYADEHAGLWPPTACELLDDGHMGANMLTCPCVEGGSGLVLCWPTQPDAVPLDTIIAADTEPRHPGWVRHVLRASLAVDALTEPEFQAELDRPENAPLRDALAGGYNPRQGDRQTLLDAGAEPDDLDPAPPTGWTYPEPPANQP